MAHLYELRAEVVSILDRRRRRSQAGKRQVLTMCVPIAVSILDRRRRRSQVGEGHRGFSSSSGFQSSIGAAAGRKADVCRPATGHERFNPRSAPPPVARIHLAHGMAGRLARFQSSIGAAAGRKPADRGGALIRVVSILDRRRRRSQVNSSAFAGWGSVFQSSIGAAAGRRPGCLGWRHRVPDCFNPRSAPPPVARDQIIEMSLTGQAFQSSIGAAAGRKPGCGGGCQRADDV